MVFNLNSFRCIARRPFVASGWWDRIRGMIGRKFSDEMDGMIFYKCSAVHSCFMSQNIDVIFVDGNLKVVMLCENLRPWIFYAGNWRAKAVIELPPGTICASGTKIGDTINLNMQPDKETLAKMKINVILEEPCK